PLTPSPCGARGHLVVARSRLRRLLGAVVLGGGPGRPGWLTSPPNPLSLRGVRSGDMVNTCTETWFTGPGAGETEGPPCPRAAGSSRRPIRPPLPLPEEPPALR